MTFRLSSIHAFAFLFLVPATQLQAKPFEFVGDSTIRTVDLQAGVGGIGINRSGGRADAATAEASISVGQEKSHYWYGNRRSNEIYYAAVRGDNPTSHMWLVDGQRMGVRSFFYGGSFMPGKFLSAVPLLGALSFQLGTDLSHERLSVTAIPEDERDAVREGHVNFEHAPRRSDYTVGPALKIRYEQKLFFVQFFTGIEASYRFSLVNGTSAFSAEALVGFGGVYVD